MALLYGATAGAPRLCRHARSSRTRALQTPRFVSAAAAAAPSVAAVAEPAATAAFSFLHPVGAAFKTVEQSVFSVVRSVLLAVVGAVARAAADPWQAEDVWFVLLWFVGIQPALQAVHGLRSKLRETTKPWEESFEAKLLPPLRQLGYVFAALWSFDNLIALSETLGFVAESQAPHAFVSGFPLACYALWAGALALDLQEQWFASLAGPSGTKFMLERAARLATILTTVIVSLQFVGVSPKTLLAFGGLAGFATSLAIKDVASNLFGGLSLLVQRPFAVGDKITFKGNSGVTVYKLGYLQTVCRMPDTSLVYIPNALFTSAELSNASRNLHFKMSGSVTLRPKDISKLEALLPMLAATLKSLPQVVEQPVVVCGGFSASPPGPLVKIDAAFEKGKIGKDELLSKAWLAVAEAVRKADCDFAS